MASDPGTLEAIVDTVGLGARLTHRRMFGEYALYIDGKVVAFICENRLLIKPTAEGRAAEPALPEGEIYPGSKLHLHADELLDERERLIRLLLRTFDVLPWPKPKKPAVKRTAPTPAKKATARKLPARKTPPR